MSDIEIHADYDRDGRLTGNRREYRERTSGHGAILLANLDKDSATGLHRQPITGAERQRLDRDLRDKGRRDDDPTRIRLQIAPAARGRAGCTWYLVVRGQAADKIGVFDGRGRHIDPVISRFDALRYPINVNTARLNLKLESITLPGSPMNRPLTQSTVYTPLTLRDSLIDVEVICVDGQRRVTVEDRARFSIAPFIVPANTEQPERVFMCAIQENLPSWVDFSNAIRGVRPRVPFDLITDQVDLWMQDQFQVGYMRGPHAWMRSVLHLPRARENVLSVQFRANLADFVNKRLPDAGTGLFNDFWERPIPIRNTQGNVTLMSFLDSGRIRLKISSMIQVRKRILYELTHSPRSADQAAATRIRQQPGGFVQWRRQFGELWRVLNASLRQRARQAANDELRESLEEVRQAFSAALNKVRRDFPLVGNNKICIPDSETTHVQMFDQQANELAARIWQLHGSENYGGNLEALPATDNRPLGSLVIGNTVDADGISAMDPDLLNFLRAQRVQPVIQIDTSWLGVAHVDEVMCVVPRGSGRVRFSVLRASSYLATRLMDLIIAAHQSGLPAGSANLNPYPPGPAVRSMAEGTVPVTRMFRGLSFLHYHPPGAEEKNPPPTLYLNRLRYSQNQTSLGNFPYSEGEGTRYYPADFTALELRYFERDVDGNSCNETYEPWYLALIDDALTAVDTGIDIVLLPALYDPVAKLDDLAAHEAATVGLLPNSVNMQVLGQHVFVPKQYGPRMRRNDAVAVLRAALRESRLGKLAGRVNRNWFRRRNLDKTEIYVHPDLGNMTTLADVAAQFADGFPGQTIEQVERRIRRVNRSSFRRNGDLRPNSQSYNWRGVDIPENTVDIFQAYIHIVLESLGLRVHWIDTWYYHLRHGEIHCGTNVIRRPPTRGVPDWWEVQIQ